MFSTRNPCKCDNKFYCTCPKAKKILRDLQWPLESCRLLKPTFWGIFYLHCSWTVSVHQNNPKLGTCCAKAVHKTSWIWPFWGKFGHYLPLKPSMFSHLEPIPVRISCFGYFFTLDHITRYQNNKYLNFLTSKKDKNYTVLTIMWS